MSITVLRVFAVTFLLVAAACDGLADPSEVGYAGTWRGSTAQGALVEFTVSSSDAVTSFTLGDSPNACGGAGTLSNLNVSIVPNVVCIPGPCPPSLSSYRAFSLTLGERPGPLAHVNGLFPIVGQAQGTINFL